MPALPSFREYRTRINSQALRLTFLIGCFACEWAAHANLAFGATFTVTNTNDAGAGSFRQAVIDANALAGADTIVFDAALFSTPQTITLTTGEMLISGPLTIDGPTALLTISGSNAGRIFRIDNGDFDSINVTIQDMKFMNGHSIGGNPTGAGGAIYCWNENLTLTDCIFLANVSDDSSGAIHYPAPGGSLSITRCTFDSNDATAAGAAGAIGLYGSVALTVFDSTFRNNHARSNGALGQFAGGSCLISGSTFFQNSATLSVGGAMVFNSDFTSHIIRNCTITNNGAFTWGGGICLGSVYTGVCTIQNCTITGNGATVNDGGGIARLFGSTGTIVLDSCIVHGNGSGNTGPDIYTSGSVNASACLIGSVAGITTLTSDAFTNSHIGVNPMVALLLDNGGPTLTRALLPGSPAIDNGLNPAGLTTDQRGAGFVRVAESACPGAISADIGAFEVQQPSTPCLQACCTEGNGCVMLGPLTCLANGDAPQGQGTNCGSGVCMICPADVTGDGNVNISDLLFVIANWGAGAGNPADVDGNGNVNIQDLLAVIAAWGSCP